MDIYIAICEDRHTDSVVRVFDTPDAAIGYAKKFMAANAIDPVDDIMETPIEGWLYHATYSCESDSVRVEQGVLNDAN